MLFETLRRASVGQGLPVFSQAQGLHETLRFFTHFTGSTMSKPKTSAPRLYGIQGLRGLAVLMVFSVHLYEVERKYSHGPRVFGDWIHLSNFGLDLFFVISGFVLTFLAFGHFAERSYLKSYAYNRVTRVYPTYLLYTLPLVPVYLFKPTLFNATDGHQVDLFRTLLLLPDVTLPLIPVAWTLHHELVFYVLFAGVLLFSERLLPRFIALGFAGMAVLATFGALIPRAEQGAFARIVLNPINFDFLMGMVLAWLIHKGERRAALPCLLLGVAAAVGGYFGFYALTGADWIGNYHAHQLLGLPAGYHALYVFGLPAALVVYGIVALEMEKGWVFGRAIAWIGDASYSIYLTHVMVIVLAGRIWGSVGVPGWPAHLAFLLATTAIGLGLGTLAYHLFEKRMTQFFRQHDPARRAKLRAAAQA